MFTQSTANRALVPPPGGLAELYYQVAWQSCPQTPTSIPFDVGLHGRDSQLLKNLPAVDRRIGHRRTLFADGPPAKTGVSLGAESDNRGVSRGRGDRHNTIRFTGKVEGRPGRLVVTAFGMRHDMPRPLPCSPGSDPMSRTLIAPHCRGASDHASWCMPFHRRPIVCQHATLRACTVKVESMDTTIAAPLPLRFHAFPGEQGSADGRGQHPDVGRGGRFGRFVGCVWAWKP